MRKINLLKTFTLVFGLVILAIGCKKENKTTTPTPEAEPAEQQNVVNFYFNGSWNNVCGMFGKPVKDSLNEKYGNRNVMIHLGYNGTGTETDILHNQQCEEFAQVLSSSTITPPIFFLGAANKPFEKSNNTTSVLKDVTFGLFQTAIANKPTAGIMSFITLEGSTLTVRTKSKFFADVPQEHFVAAYLLEDNVAQTQTGDRSKKLGIQDNVFRTKISTGVTGSLLGSQFKKGDIKELTLTKDIGTANAANKANLKVAVVLWYRTPGGSFYVSNGYISKL